jgi:large conductance mechanosensitive channel
MASDENKLTEATKKVSSFFDEFKAFALKGNVIDLAIGVIIGAAFGKIVDSLVKDIFLPLIAGVLPGDQGYLGWKLNFNGSEILIGKFLGELVNFVIVAFALFLFIKKFLGFVTRLREKEAEGTSPPPPLTKDQELLTEIRDLLKNRTGNNPPIPGS